MRRRHTASAAGSRHHAHLVGPALLLLASCSHENTPIQPESLGSGTPGRDRPVIERALTARIDQYSNAVQLVTEAWTGSSPHIPELAEIAGVAEIAALAEHRTSGGDELRTFGQTVTVALQGFAEMYGRLLDTALRLDDLSFVGSEFAVDEEEIGAALNNPQWTAAMFERTFHAMRVLGDLYRYNQVAGAREMAASIARSEDEIGKVAAYVVYSDVFNTWVRRVAAGTGRSPSPSSLLPINSELTGDDVASYLSRVDRIVAELPLGVVLSTTARSRPPEESSFWDDVLDFAHRLDASFLGTIADEVFGYVPEEWMRDIPSSLDGLATLLSDPRWAPKFFDVKVLEDLTLGFIIDRGIDDLYRGVESWAPSAACALDLARTGFGAGAAAVGTVAMAPSVVGATVFGAVYVNELIALRDAIGRCEEEGVFSDETDRSLVELADGMEVDGRQPDATQVGAVTNADIAECDQLRRAGVVPRRITPRSPTSEDSPAFDQQSVEDARMLLGLGDGTPLPRTFDDLENAVAALLYDHGRRNPSTVDPAVDGESLSFLATAFALLIRREPGDDTVSFPAISDVELVCSSPGFVPAWSHAPMDVTDIDSLPELVVNDGVSGGGNVEVD